MTSRAVLVLALTAMLVNVTSADLQKRSITDYSGKSSETHNITWLWRPTFWIAGGGRESPPDTGAGGQSGGLTQKWLLDSLTKKEEIISKNVEIINAKEKELWELRSKVKQLETMCDVTGSEALINKTLQLQSENLKCKFYSNELDQNNQLLKQRVESLKEEVKQYREANNSEYLQLSSRQDEQRNDLRLEVSELKALVQNLTTTRGLHQTEVQTCTSKICNKIAELKMMNWANHYYYFSEQTNKKTWHEAFSFCKSHGLDLVTIESAEENNFITDHLLQLYGSGWNQHYWLGGNDLAAEGKWVWSSTGQPLAFNAWGSGEPGSGTTYNCLLTHFPTSDHRKWFDYPCTNKLPFICEMKEECN